MAIALIEYGALRVEAKYLQQRDGIYYFRRRIPADVRHHYPKIRADFFLWSLQTRDKLAAAKEAHRLAARQDAAWRRWRSGKTYTGKDDRALGEELLQGYGLTPGDGRLKHDFASPVDDFEDLLRHLTGAETLEEARLSGSIPAYADHAATLLYEGRKSVPTLSEALEIFQNWKEDADDTERKVRDRLREVNFVVDRLGDRPLNEYSRDEANSIVAAMRAEGVKPKTVLRRINRIRAIFSFVMREQEIEGRNQFEKLSIPGLQKDDKPREPYGLNELELVQKACRLRDDPMRWAIAMASDSGLRVAELIGLRLSDIVLEGPIPYLNVQSFAGRGLKTKASERHVPLVGASLWAARRIKSEEVGDLAFPQYWSSGELKATSASNALNKWIKGLGIDKTMHSFRHSFRDRLREVGTHEEVAFRLGGWNGRKSVGNQYGGGHSLGFLLAEMEKIVLPFWSATYVADSTES